MRAELLGRDAVVLGLLFNEPVRELLGGREPDDVLREGHERVALQRIEQRVVGILVERRDDLLDALLGEHEAVLRRAVGAPANPHLYDQVVASSARRSSPFSR